MGKISYSSPYRAFFILLALLLGVVACNGRAPSPTAEETLQSMMEKIGGGPDTGSVEDSFYKQAKAEEAKGNLKQASQLYKGLIEGYPDNDIYKVKLGKMLRQMGDYNKALEVQRAVLAKDSNNIDAQEEIGLSLLSTGEYGQASRAFSSILKRDKSRWRTLNSLGILFATRNMTAESLEFFQLALEQSKGNPIVLNNTALTYAINRKTDLAIRLLNKASSKAKRANVKRHVDLNLALLYGIKGDFDKASRVASKHLDSITLNNNLGIYAYLAKDNTLAQSYLNMALTQSKTHYEKAWHNLEDVIKNSSPDGSGRAILVVDRKKSKNLNDKLGKRNSVSRKIKKSKSNRKSKSKVKSSKVKSNKSKVKKSESKKLKSDKKPAKEGASTIKPSQSSKEISSKTLPPPKK